MEELLNLGDAACFGAVMGWKGGFVIGPEGACSARETSRYETLYGLA